MNSQEKYQALLAQLAQLGRVAVAFSGGVDSTLLLHAAREALGPQALAITAHAATFPQWEQTEAEAFCQARNIPLLRCPFDPMAVAGFSENSRNRCYLCKKALFQQICALARQAGCTAVVEGSNLDDDGDYRPGRAAIQELGVHSPLHQAGLTKSEIRALSQQFGLPTWDKPSYACLASRFPYGESITPQGLEMVAEAEAVLRRLGFSQLRVRLHGTLGRIEVPPEDLPRLMAPETRQQVCHALGQLGFSYVTADLQGYRTGSLNESFWRGGPHDTADTV